MMCGKLVKIFIGNHLVRKGEVKYNTLYGACFSAIRPVYGESERYSDVTIFSASLEETLPGSPKPVVVLCADVAGSTRLYDTLGDTHGQGIILACMAAISNMTAGRGGRVVKTIGDEALCVFAHPIGAVLAAGEIHHAIAELNSTMDMPLGPTRVRIAIHRGPAIVEDTEIFGDAVKVVSQVVNLAKPEQTLATANIVKVLPEEVRPSLRFFDDEILDAGRRPIVLHEVIWQMDDATDAVTRPGTDLRTTHVRLVLELDDQVFELNETRPRVELGRGESCDIRYPSGLASRHHAHIELRRGRFAVIDNSANGTFVVDDSGTVASIHRDEILLKGIGYITLGELPEKPGTPVIRYRCH